MKEYADRRKKREHRRDQFHCRYKENRNAAPLLPSSSFSSSSSSSSSSSIILSKCLLSFSLRPFTEENKEIRKDSISYEAVMGISKEKRSGSVDG
jgi:hypothetical protein